jgi:hypothetical protein
MLPRSFAPRDIFGPMIADRLTRRQNAALTTSGQCAGWDVPVCRSLRDALDPDNR